MAKWGLVLNYDETAEKLQLIAISGGENEIIHPFRIAIRLFTSETYEINHWPYILGKNKIKDL